MYKIFGFKPDDRFGRVAEVEFSVPARGSYAYLLGSFNAFNEGSFRMRRKRNRWSIKLGLPEGIWHYCFSLDGEFLLDPENPERETYRRLSYKFEKKVSVARIVGEGEFFHRPSATYLYSFAGRTHVVFRALKGKAQRVVIRTGNAETKMRAKAHDELFEYFEAVLSGEGPLEYSFVVESMGKTIEYGPFNAEPYKFRAPMWVFERVFYQIMPDRFDRGLPGTPIGRAFRRDEFHGGDLAGITKRLDHLEDLGVNALYLTPIFESTTYHRYDVTDYFRIDRKLGGWGAFRELVRKLKERDIRIVLDGVFHHTSFFHPYFQDVVMRGKNSRYGDFYRVISFPVVPEEFMEILKSDESWGERYKKLKGLNWNYESFYSVWLMPRLNHDSPAVKRFIEDVMLYWLEKGTDGWRLDVAHGVPPGLWREIRRAMPERAYLVGEVMDDARLWTFDVFHGTMNYPLYELILRFFVEREIDAGEFLNGLELLSAHLGPAEYAMYNFLDNHDTERFIDLVGDERKYLCALAFLMTYKGVPSIFYGDEIGLNGGGEGLSAGRTPMKWNAEEWNLNVLKATKELVRLRRESRALQLGEFRPRAFKKGLILYERTYGGERVLVGINYSEETAVVNVPREYAPAKGGDKRMELAPWSFIVLTK
ncbi:alpha amylase N-terminal ig-like domain-containing protein [Thermococcus sp. 21S7]|uniref:alpha amylase N-terminal ig-like domain-containing protein n=1 Tax=Thermococcus sp. 21S7 TaxID=1638221 RepID=UPI00143BDB24|nr:glycoside hydrolase family 13 protein [Thermococcus sp. 21S7]